MNIFVPDLSKNETGYYSNKIKSLCDIFGTTDILIENRYIIINGHSYPVINDVIILLDPSQYPESVKKTLDSSNSLSGEDNLDFSKDIQFTFGAEWQNYPDIMPDHLDEFNLYFDLVNISDLINTRVCDLGCGIGRWSHFLKDRCRELVLVDFSEAIFVARHNLKCNNNTLFFMGDLRRLPFKDKFADFLFCLGVLHHLPVNALEEVRSLKKYATTLLIYLYYALDNRPFYFQIILSVVTFLRKVLSKIRSPWFRNLFSVITTLFVYKPFIYIGQLLNLFGLETHVPLFEAYNGKSINRIQQDVYDRFFTSIEQRFTKKQILELKDSFDKITVSEHIPYWHFKCENTSKSNGH